MRWILNTTFHVTESRKEEFLTWLHNIMIPTIKSFGNGISYTHCLEIMVELSDNTHGYAIQINADTNEHLMEWINSQKAHLLNMSLHKKFGEDVLAFNTPMHIIHP